MQTPSQNQSSIYVLDKMQIRHTRCAPCDNRPQRRTRQIPFQHNLFLHSNTRRPTRTRSTSRAGTANPIPASPTSPPGLKTAAQPSSSTCPPCTFSKWSREKAACIATSTKISSSHSRYHSTPAKGCGRLAVTSSKTTPSTMACPQIA